MANTAVCALPDIDLMPCQVAVWRWQLSLFLNLPYLSPTSFVLTSPFFFCFLFFAYMEAPLGDTTENLT